MEEFTLRVKAIRRQARLSITGDWRSLVSRAGTGLLVVSYTWKSWVSGRGKKAAHTPE